MVQLTARTVTRIVMSGVPSPLRSKGRRGVRCNVRSPVPIEVQKLSNGGKP